MLKGMVKKGEIVEWGVNEEWEKDNFQINIFLQIWTAKVVLKGY